MKRRRLGKSELFGDLLQRQIGPRQVINRDVPPQLILKFLKTGAFLAQVPAQVLRSRDAFIYPSLFSFRYTWASNVPIEQGALLEMMGNLLENAYRLCLGEVRISVRESLDGIELCIEDDGPGVPPDQRARILECGERLDRQHPGQGIGLAVVKDIIES